MSAVHYSGALAWETNGFRTVVEAGGAACRGAQRAAYWRLTDDRRAVTCRRCLDRIRWATIEECLSTMPATAKVTLRATGAPPGEASRSVGERIRISQTVARLRAHLDALDGLLGANVPVNPLVQAIAFTAVDLACHLSKLDAYELAKADGGSQ